MNMEVVVCYAPRRLGIECQEVEALRPGDALVKIAYCGVCPWDLRAFAGLSSSTRYPLRLGHEVTGVVEAVGSNVRDLPVGTRVLVDVIRRCGTCRACRHGRENQCENADFSRGGFAQYIVMPAENIYPLRDTTPLLAAALTEPLACVVRGQNAIGVSKSDVVLLMGAGPLGLLHLQVMKSRGATAIVLDPLEPRLETARQLGADVTILPERDDFAGVIAAHTEGYGVDAAIVATSQIAAVHQTLPALGVGGRLLLFAGLYPQSEMSLNLNLIHYRELVLTGTSDYTRSDFAEALQLIEDGAVQTGSLVSHVFSLHDIERALSTVETRGGLKTVIRCNDLEAYE